jgi:hypothetical protein
VRPGPHSWVAAWPSGCYGVIAMAAGPLPTVIALPALLVAVVIGVTVSAGTGGPVQVVPGPVLWPLET